MEISRTYLELDDRIKFIVCGVKLWMKKNDLSDRNLFTTYATIWMVFYFLMQPEISVVPSVLAIRNELPASQRMVIVEGKISSLYEFLVEESTNLSTY